ncbi:MAG: hypothetical protein H6642_09145 [Caldilineaceae bacterium]|nr:hypothetical protein [Caldilineaceae bacterium]
MCHSAGAAAVSGCLTRIVIALAAKKTGCSIHDFSFERAHKLIQGFMRSHFHKFLLPSLFAIESIFQRLIDIVAALAKATRKPKIIELREQFA